MMITFPMLEGIETNLLLLILLGFTIGIVSGFVGLGGGFLMTPALIILGFPASFAVGTSLVWMTGSAITGALRHRQLGNIDMKLGLWMVVGTMCGIEVGVRILDEAKNVGLANQAVLTVSIVILLIIGVYTLSEAHRTKVQLDEMIRKKEKLPPAMRGPVMSQRLKMIGLPPMIHFTKSRLTISLWVILAIGFVTGVLAGFIGLAGGFVMVPSLVYLIGLPSFMAVGTSMFQIVFSAAFAGIRHTMSGNVIIFASFILLVSSCIGVQFGALTTRYVRGVSMRYILALSMLLCVLGSTLKLLDVSSELPVAWLQTGSIVVIFGGLGLLVIMIISLFVLAIRYRKSKYIPIWAVSLVSKED